MSKCDAVWDEIAKEINYIKSVEALYTYVVCNQDNVRECLWQDFREGNSLDSSIEEEIGKSLVENSTLHSTTENEAIFSFTIHVPAPQFDQLVETQVLCVGKNKQRNVKKFRKGQYSK